MGGWIKNSKLYVATTKRWYCPMCDRRTRIEVNLQWLEDGKPLKWNGDKDYGWFTCCADCKHKHYIGSYNCPNCGCPIDDQDPIETTEPVYNSYYSYEFGVTGYDWEERHQCCKCRTRFWVSNSSC
jgi:hypothetical protein